MRNLLLIIGCFLSLAVAGQNRFTNAGSWEEVFAKAGAQHKMVIIDCYFEGCHPCKQMDDEVFVHSAVSQLMDQQFIGIKTDCLKEQFGKDLQMKFGVTGFPTYLIFTGDGVLVDYFSGYKEADRFLNLLRAALRQNRSGKTLSGFTAGMNVVYPAFYTAFFRERKSFSKEELQSYFYRQVDPFKESAIMPVLMARALTDSLSHFVLNNYNKLITMFGKGLVNAQRMRIVQGLIVKGPAGVNEKWLKSFLAKMQSYSNTEDWPYFQLDIAEAYFYNHLKDPAAFFRFAANHSNDDDNKVRYMGMRLAHPGMTDEQRDLYIEWVSGVLDQRSSEDALLSAASVLLGRGRKKDAGRLAEWALQKARLNNRDTARAQNIINKINS